MRGYKREHADEPIELNTMLKHVQTCNYLFLESKRGSLLHTAKEEFEVRHEYGKTNVTSSGASGHEASARQESNLGLGIVALCYHYITCTSTTVSVWLRCESSYHYPKKIDCEARKCAKNSQHRV